MQCYMLAPHMVWTALFLVTGAHSIHSLPAANLYNEGSPGSIAVKVYQEGCALKSLSVFSQFTSTLLSPTLLIDRPYPYEALDMA